MKTKNTVDIILPNYNKARFIPECLHSLKTQSFQDWRCIVVDGFSDDGSWEIIQKFAREDERFDLYQLPRIGLYKSWNFGLSKVISPYFCILTSDDIWDKNWLQLAIQSFANNSKAICVAARTYHMDADSRLKGIAFHNQLGERFFMTDNSIPQLRNGIVDSMAQYFLGSIYTSVHSLLLKSEILSLSGFFSEDLGNAGDQEWYIKLGLYGDIVYHPEIKAGWRNYQEQTTKLIDLREMGETLQKFHARLRESIAEKLGNFGTEFISIAEEYDRQILSYSFERPPLDNLISRPLLETPKLLEIVSKKPSIFFKECFFKILGKRYISERSLEIAQLVYSSIPSVLLEKRWKEESNIR